MSAGEEGDGRISREEEDDRLLGGALATPFEFIHYDLPINGKRQEFLNGTGVRICVFCRFRSTLDSSTRFTCCHSLFSYLVGYLLKNYSIVHKLEIQSHLVI